MIAFLSFAPFILSIIAVVYLLRQVGRGWESAVFGGMLFISVAFGAMIGIVIMLDAVGMLDNAKATPDLLYAFIVGPWLALGWLWYRAYRQSKE